MTSFEELQQAVETTAAALAEVERQRPSKQGPVLTGSCKEDVRLGNEWLACANERAAIRAAWEDKRDVHKAAHRKACAAHKRWWNALVEKAQAENERWWNALVVEAMAENERWWNALVEEALIENEQRGRLVEGR